MYAITAATRMSITVLPVISFIAVIVAWTVIFPFIASAENCSDSNMSFLMHIIRDTNSASDMADFVVDQLSGNKYMRKIPTISN